MSEYWSYVLSLTNVTNLMLLAKNQMQKLFWCELSLQMIRSGAAELKHQWKKGGTDMKG
jgi:hypothetical protein